MADLAPAHVGGAVSAEQRIELLQAIERKLLWLSSWTIHNANHLRASRDKLKVGGHQASCASVASIMTALFFDVLRPGDRVAVKPHASPIYHAAMHLLGREPIEQLQRFRALGGAQSYPSRTKDQCGVDFSTGSVGSGRGHDPVRLADPGLRPALHGLGPDGQPTGRMVAIVGDAELDEGNVYEALLEGWKHDVRNLWWVIDYNRQSLDRVVPELLFAKIEQFFATVGWRVVTIKYGKRLQAAFARPGGEALRAWIDGCPNDLYAALCFKGGAAWRAHLESDLGRNPGIRGVLDGHDDEALAALMTNLGGHDLEAVLEAFHGVADDRPHCFIAYTVKGWGLPFAGHKDNHAGLMTPEQMAALQRRTACPAARNGRPTPGWMCRRRQLEAFLAGVPYRSRVERHDAAPMPVPASLPQGRRAAHGIDPGSVRADHGRARAQRPAAGRAHRHHLAGRHGLDQARRLGRPARRVQPPRPRGRVPRRAGGLADALAREPHRPASRARHRREQPVPQPREPGPRPRAVRRPPAAGRHALRPVHRPRPRCAELRLLPGRPLPAGGDALGHHAGAGGRRAPVDRHAR